MNSRSLSVRRSLALTAALGVATLGATALPATAADPGQNDDSPGQTRQQDRDRKDKKDKDETDDGDTDGSEDGDTDGTEDDGTDTDGTDGDTDTDGTDDADTEDDGTEDDSDADDADDADDPAGNNGTVKVAPYGELDGIPDNTPHPGCEFQIEWYGFDEGADIWSTVSFAMKAPTSDVALAVTGPESVFVGEDPASGAGTDTGLDGTETYTLSFDGEPHPKQGYHVKLTVATPESNGNDTKSKVFWVESCEETTSGTTEGDTEDTEVLGVQASTGDDTEVMGVQAAAMETGSDVPTAVEAGEQGNPVADLVSSPSRVGAFGLAAVLAGVALLVRRRLGAS